MSHKLLRPWVTDHPTQLHTGASILVSKVAVPEPGKILLQGRPVGTGALPVTWEAKDYDIAEMLFARIIGYRGIPFMHYSGDAWADLRKKINSERELDERRRTA